MIMFSDVNDARIIELPKIPEVRGNLSFIESNIHIPFKIKRTYWIYDVPGGVVRGGHAFKKQNEFIVAISGSFDVIVSDENTTRKISLNRSYFGLYIPNMLWRSLENFSTNSLALIVSDIEYKEEDYIRDVDEYRKLRNAV